MLLQEPGSPIGEVVKVMSKKKVLVKVKTQNLKIDKSRRKICCRYRQRH
jgi:hypothetical protein